MGWLHVAGSLKLQVSFAKEPYERDDVLQKRPMILRRLLIVSNTFMTLGMCCRAFVNVCVCECVSVCVLCVCVSMKHRAVLRVKCEFALSTCVAVSCSVLAVCCSVLQWVAVSDV